MKKNIKNLCIFICICTVITLLLATTNYFTAPIIEQNQNASANKALLEVMPNGKSFETVDISKLTLPSTVTEAYKETSGQGYVIRLVTSGYGSDMVIMCGVSTDGVVTGAVCLSSNETLSKEKTYGENFASKDAAGVESVDTITGATKTTEAYKNAVKDALNSVIILGGGSVDIRNEEEILNDNLNEALPDGEKKFEKLFITEQLDGIDAVYGAENKSGYVFVVGEQFIGVKADGTVVTANVENTTIYTDAINKITSSTLVDIDLSSYTDLQNTIVSAKKTASGNFVIEAKGAGYGIKGGDEYHPASNEYIIVRVAVTPDYKIIDCLTVSEAETDGLGDACADEEFYGQFIGKTEANYTEIDAISGATLTTNGYKQAIERAFAAVKILKGGA
ncbi:MAG: FMN-binding protein [Acutalibacteraceae bacterium]|nr:FMN-binding protein [Acutalibacteraceae bacterium]